MSGSVARNNSQETQVDSVGQVVVEMRGMRDMLLAKIEATRDRMDDRDRLYAERELSNKAAIRVALDAAETLTKATFDWSDKAITKAEKNAESWRASANEWRGAMDDREKKFATKPEMLSEITNINTALANLKEGKANIEGAKMSRTESRSSIMAIVGIVGVALTIIGIAIALVLKTAG